MKKRPKARKLNAEQLFALRQSETKPLLEKLRIWLEEKSLQVVPKSLHGKHVSFTLDK